MNKTIEKFIEEATLASATAEVISNDAESLYKAIMKEIEEEELVLLSDPDDLTPDLFSKIKEESKIIQTPTVEQLRTIKCGISDAFGGVAATGSVCVSASNKLSSIAGMITQKHIVVLEAKTIVPRPRDILSEDYLDGKGLKRSFSYITGSSATADMGPLVRGVHGPGELHIIILEEK